ncbi:methyltransferase [Conyzicola sp.]|uniref:methyltransferase n=1 Tax=Conyzicola sp. TaxID=1969404 RepID=UPI00398995C4
MSDTSTTTRTWVANGPAGTLGWVRRLPEGYTFNLVGDDGQRAVYPSLDVAKSALHASLVPGTDWPEFREH